MKKAQMEILGLVVIIVLISLGVLFAVKYIAPVNDIKVEFIQRNTAQNMLNVMLNSDVNCNGNFISIQDMLIDCKTYDGGSIRCDNQFSCQYVENEINNIFDNTLNKWETDYYFEANNIQINNKCDAGKKTGVQPLPYGFTVILEVCD